MRRMLFFMMVSLDGFFAGPGGELDWHHVDEEFNEFALAQLGEVGMLLFGRMTYEGMASYWPTPAAKSSDPEVAQKMNEISKIVFSRTLRDATWENTRLIRNDYVKEISKLKAESGKDMIIFGSSDLAVSFIRHGLIDEFRIMVNPVVLGKGKRLFEGLEEKLDLKLRRSQAFRSGNVLLVYTPAAAR